MADTIEIDLPILKRFIQDGLNLRSSRLHSFSVEISISPGGLSAILADDFSGIGDVGGPRKLIAATTARE
jgi:hypothetical protein